MAEAAAFGDAASDMCRRALSDGALSDGATEVFVLRSLLDDRLRSGLAVFVDGANSRRRLRAKVQPESELYFIESLGGGGLTPTLELKRS